MKTKNFSILIFAALVAVTGCKKETTLTGQMFIVTQGADNVKLGDVEILLIEKPQVADFLQKKQPTIDSEIESQREELTNEEEKVTAAFKNGENAEKDYVSLSDNPPYEKDPDYIKIKSQLTTVSRLKDTFQQQYDSLDAKVTSATSDGSSDMDAFNALLAQRSSAQQSLDIENNMVTSLQAKLDAIQSLAEADANGKVEAAQSHLKSAESDAAMTRTNLESLPSAEDYFGDFLPVVFQKTISDSDGKFSFVYPRDKSFALFARAQRMILNKTETYYWLIDAPSGSKAAQILLSNNNLVFVDPDGYFKLKPKEAPQKTSEQ